MLALFICYIWINDHCLFLISQNKMWPRILYIYLKKKMGPVVAQSVPVKSTCYGFDPHSRRQNIYLHLYFHFFALVSRQSVALSSATQHGKWGAVSINTRFPTLLCVGYNVKLIFIKKTLKIKYRLSLSSCFIITFIIIIFETLYQIIINIINIKTLKYNSTVVLY